MVRGEGWSEKMAYGCTICGGKLGVENTANIYNVLTYRCRCGQSYWGSMIPGTSQQAAHWLGRRAEIKLGRLVKLARQDGAIVALDTKPQVLVRY